ncbi:hypothetical protein [Salsuginibacillus kocurii]|uniref:hypothetical protein n=1 Tax=Salsuginibacillus kocurii TaxID=427078 RepID=UPI0003713BFF|nr:hypothetical protein [Salsuginibacillus kocurii]
MLQSMYQRRRNVSLILTGILLLISLIIFSFTPFNSADDWFAFVYMGIGLLLCLGTASISNHKLKQVQGHNLPESDASLFEANHIVIKKDVGLFPRLLLFQKNGAYAGVIKPLHIPWYCYPFGILLKESAIYLPITYGVYNSKDEIVMHLHIRGFLKAKSNVQITNAAKEHIGDYTQFDFQNLVNIRGELTKPDGDLVLAIQTKGFMGDFRLIDDNGVTWAHFYNGYFPHNYTHLFRDIDNSIVDLNLHLAERQKKLLLGFIAFSFLQRQR